MATSITIPARNIAVGSYQHEILAPTRANGALITISREAGFPWPVGNVFTYRVYEKDRTTQVLSLLTSATESGTGTEPVGKDGTLNPPLKIQLVWPVDKDRDLIRFEFDVLQPFRTALSVEFI